MSIAVNRPDGGGVPELAEAKPATDSSGQHNRSKAGRPASARDRLWLKWYEDKTADTYQDYGKIRDKWNGMSDDDRVPFAPCDRAHDHAAVVVDEQREPRLANGTGLRADDDLQRAVIDFDPLQNAGGQLLR